MDSPQRGMLAKPSTRVLEYQQEYTIQVSWEKLSDFVDRVGAKKRRKTYVFRTLGEGRKALFGSIAELKAKPGGDGNTRR